MPVLSTFLFQTPEAVFADLGRALSRLDTKEWDGFLGAWIGRTTSDKLTSVEVHLVFAWDSLEAHNAAQSNPSNLNFVSKHLNPALASSSSQRSVHTVQFTAIENNPIVAFDAPLTEVLLHTLKNGKTEDELDAAVAEVVAFLVAHGVGIRLPYLHGEVLKSTGGTDLYTAIGWDGSQAHKDALKVEGTAEYAAKFLELADVTQAWVKFGKRA